MIVKIISNQIPQFWEVIKLSALSSGGISKKYEGAFCNELLQSLLSDKSQCFVYLDEARVLKGIAITQLKAEIFGERKILEIKQLYFEDVDKAVFDLLYEYVCRFAKDMGCTFVGFDTIDKRLWDIIESSNLKEYKRYYLNELA